MPGKQGYSGRMPLRKEKDFYALLDKALPRAVMYCVKLIDEAEKLEKVNTKNITSPIELKAILEERKESKQLAVKASQILMSRAPQRLSGGDTPITFVEMNAEKYASIIGREAIRVTDSGKEEAD